MAIALPNLDDRTYADLVDEARALIPLFDPLWTNHNESDPGITLIELFAWLAEMQIFALDQITDEHRVTFLRLLNGPDWTAKRNADQTVDRRWLEEATGETVRMLRQHTRAISTADYEELACRASPQVQRARCVPRRNLEASIEAARLTAEGHVSVVILPQPAGVTDTAALCKTVYDALDTARMLTTRLHVVLPTYAPVATRVMVARRSDAVKEDLAARVQARLVQWLDAWSGDKGDGWPFGRPIYVSELNAVLSGVPGLDYVGDTLLSTTTTGLAPDERPASPIWHESGALVGLALLDHHLPRAPAKAHDVVVADQIEPIRITVTVRPAADNEDAAKQAVVQTLKDDLWVQQKNNNDSFDLSVPYVQSLLNDAPAVLAVTASVRGDDIVIEGNPARRTGTDKLPVYSFKTGEFFQAMCVVNVAGAAS